MRRLELGAVAIGLAPLLSSAATLSMRGADGEAEVNLLPGETATIQIVLEITEAETFSFINLFPQATVVDGPDDMLEVLDFGPAPGMLEDAFRDTTFLPEGSPFAFGEGFAPDEYHLILFTDPVSGPATLILEEVVIHANALGSVEFAFQDGLLAPGVFDADGITFGIAPVGINPVDTLLTLGTGDARQDGAGPLVINIVEEVPAEPVDLGSSDNSSSPGTNGTGDPNGQGDGPNQDDPAGPSGVCGPGMVAPLAVMWFGLMGLRWRSRLVLQR
ncbi:MAG: hypothetical protein IH988_00135 [Planctomycetes bacterium]|nr:hypothetical protein [Planctomycetota bacterium]